MYLPLILSTIGCVTGLLALIASFATAAWVVGSARSTHRIEYAPLEDPFSIQKSDTNIVDDSKDPSPDAPAAPNEVPDPKIDRLLAKKNEPLTDFSDLYPNIDD